MINKLNINFIDIHAEVFSKYKNPLDFFPFEKYGHYNINGYFKIAEHLSNKIK